MHGASENGRAHRTIELLQAKALKDEGASTSSTEFSESSPKQLVTVSSSQAGSIPSAVAAVIEQERRFFDSAPVSFWK